MRTGSRVPRPGQTVNAADAQRDLTKQADAIRDIQSRPIVDGFLVTDVSLSPYGVPQVVRHDLKRSANYLVTRSNAPVTVYDTTADDPDNELRLLSSAPAVVNLWIF